MSLTPSHVPFLGPVGPLPFSRMFRIGAQNMRLPRSRPACPQQLQLPSLASPPCPSSGQYDRLSWQCSLVSRMEHGLHRGSCLRTHTQGPIRTPSPSPVIPKAASLSSALSPVPSSWSLFSHYSYATLSTTRQETALQHLGDTGCVLVFVFQHSVPCRREKVSNRCRAAGDTRL